MGNLRQLTDPLRQIDPVLLEDVEFVAQKAKNAVETWKKEFDVFAKGKGWKL